MVQLDLNTFITGSWKRLAIFVVTAENGKPLRNILLYGEAVIFVGQGQDEFLEDSPALTLLNHFNPTFASARRTLLSAEAPPSDIHAAIAESAGPVETMVDVPQSTADQAFTIPLGLLASDHVGFVAFDLTRVTSMLSKFIKVQSTREGGFRGLQITFQVYHNILDKNKIDVLSNAGISKEAIVSKVELRTADAKSQVALSLPAIQDPSLIEWQISPGSFATIPQTLIGADGCETFVPANFAIEQFPLRQVQRIVGQPGNLQPVSNDFPPALVVEYQVTMTPIGHSLGQIVYSLPLAPGETVRLAVIDWRRAVTGARTEDTKLGEQLLHDQTRDRTISETLQGAIDEWQRGGSVMGGLSGGAGGAASAGSEGAAGGAMASVGGAYTTSSGTRDISVNTVQKIADAIHQASSSVRELTSTVVVQTGQQEGENVETRTFSNNNRGHTLTILYYEMLRHFHIKVEFSRFYEAVLVDKSKFSWNKAPDPTVSGPAGLDLHWGLDNDAFLLAKRYILQPALLDQTLVPAAFDALVKLEVLRRKLLLNPAPPPPVDQGNMEFSSFFVQVDTGDNKSRNTIVLQVLTRGGNWVKLTFGPDHVENLNDASLGEAFDSYNAHFRQTSDPLVTPLKWNDIDRFRFLNQDGTDKIIFLSVAIRGLLNLSSDIIEVVPRQTGTYQMENPGDEQDFLPAAPAPSPPPVATLSPEQQLAPEDYNLTQMLKEHLQIEKEYYNRILDLSIQPQAYAAEFDTIAIDVGKTLLDVASPTAIDLIGTKVAFPRLGSDTTTSNKSTIQSIYDQDDADQPLTQDRLISFPTRGLFAEAKLGHCNVAEEIDDTRFWKWDEHPLPVTAPEISPVTTVTPKDDPPTLGPSNFPASIVNIQQPPAEPDPTGAAAMLKALTTPNVFRDMSGISEVQSMLHDLTQGAVSMAQAASSLLAKGGKGSGTTDSSGTTRPQNPAKDQQKANEKQAAAQQTDPASAQHAIKLADNLAQQGKITPAKRNEIARNQVDNMKGSAPPMPAPVPVDPLRERTLQVTVRGDAGIVAVGRYQLELYQAGKQLALVEPAVWIDGTQIVTYKPVLTRPLFQLSVFGEITDGKSAGVVVDGRQKELEIPGDDWDKYDYHYASCDLTTQQFVDTAKTTDEIIKKFTLSGNAGATTSASIALEKVVNIVAKDDATAGLGFIWTPGDETKTEEKDITMTLTYYTGGLIVSKVH